MSDIPNLVESVLWRDASEQLPDSDQAVLVCAPTADEPVWLGYHDGEAWIDVNGETLPPVTHWAHLPCGVT